MAKKKRKSITQQIMSDAVKELNKHQHDLTRQQYIRDIAQNRQGERIYSTKGTAITLTANGGGKFSKTGGYLIYNKVRKLTPRECARLIGFPDQFKICESNNQAYKQFGNSVVVDVIQYILLSVAEAVEEGNVINSTTEKSGSNTTENVFNDLSSTFMVEDYKLKLDTMEMDEYLYRKINPSGI